MLAATVEIGSSVWPDIIRPHLHIVIALGVFGLLCVIVPAVHTGYSWVSSKLRHNSATPPLEIIFDPSNPARRHWSEEQLKDEKGGLSSPILGA